MSSSPSPEEIESVTLTDESGRSLTCYVEHTLEIEGEEYLLLLPVDAPIQIFAWDEEDEEEEAAEATLVEDEEEIDKIFSTAQAVLSELNLSLKRTAYALTVGGELPEVNEDDILTLEMEEDELEEEQFQLLTSFYVEEQEYAIYTPLDPLLFFARVGRTGSPELLSPEEFKHIQPFLEEQLFDEME